MRLENLALGDLVFFVSPSLDIVEHTAIFLGIKKGVPYVIHATREPYRSVMVTRLKNEDEEFIYHIMRPANVTIAIEAVAILLAWVEYQVPYASEAKYNKRMAEAERHFSFELKSSAPAQMEYGIQNYAISYAQYIEMANHLPYVTTIISASGVGCAEVAVMAFNIAFFILNGIFREDIQQWTIPSHSTSIYDFATSLDNPLPFDSSNALSAGVFEYCRIHPEHWLNLDMLERWEESRDSLAEDKDAWRTFKEELKSRAQRLTESPKEVATRARTFTNEGSKGSFDFIDVIEFSAQQIEIASPDARMNKSPVTLFFSPEKFKKAHSPSSRTSFSFFSLTDDSNEEFSVAQCFEGLGVQNF